MQSRDPFKKMIREDYDIPPAGWSNWVLVLRQTTSCSDFDICMHRSEDNIGYYSNGWYNAETVQDKSGACVIFELRLAGNYTNWPVYPWNERRNDYIGCRRFMEDTSKMSLFF